MSENLQNIFKLSTSRPKLEIAKKTDEENVAIEPESLNKLVFITECTKCHMVLKRKPAKVVIEKCQNLVLTLEAGITTGTIEIIKCENITIIITEGIKLSIVMVDGTTSLELVLHENEGQIEQLYQHESSKLSITVKRKGEDKTMIITPPPDDPTYLQFKSHWMATGEGGLQLVTEKVMREGIYPYTEGTK